MPLQRPSFFNTRTTGWVICCVFTLVTGLYLGLSMTMRFSQQFPVFLSSALSTLATSASVQHNDNASTCPGTTNVSLSWYPPTKWSVNNLNDAINGTGVYGFIFNSSQHPADTYYDWCNMPHTNPETYIRPDSSYQLEYVEVIHRHHKRTPYAANTFPHENYPWYCSNEGLAFGGKPINPYGNTSAATYWQVYTSPTNPYPPEGFNGTCQFPQITRGGLDDSHQHGVDLKEVYAGQVDFLPLLYDPNTVSYRVTNNVITSQVAAMLIPGMFLERTNLDTPLLVQPDSIDSLEPAYTCTTASNLFNSYGPGSSSPAWLAHLDASASLYTRLDALSGVSPTAEDWHMSWDHYFDNLSSRLCDAKPLPCSTTNSTDCVSPAEADEVFRLGEYEYSFVYRDRPQSLPASVGSFGIWVAELAQNLRHAMGEAPASTAGTSPASVRYRHNIAHDGSMARLLAILQIDRMVWPGMGSEVVFELYRKNGCYFLRVLWGGRVMTSSHPAFGRFDMVPVATFLAYVDGLVGVGASKIPGICQTPECAIDGEGC